MPKSPEECSAPSLSYLFLKKSVSLKHPRLWINNIIKCLVKKNFNEYKLLYIDVCIAHSSTCNKEIKLWKKS